MPVQPGDITRVNVARSLARAGKPGRHLRAKNWTRNAATIIVISMKTSRRRRTARKLILPLIAVGLMTAMMGLDASRRLPYKPPTAATQTR